MKKIILTAIVIVIHLYLNAQTQPWYALRSGVDAKSTEYKSKENITQEYFDAEMKWANEVRNRAIAISNTQIDKDLCNLFYFNTVSGLVDKVYAKTDLNKKPVLDFIEDKIANYEGFVARAPLNFDVDGGKKTFAKKGLEKTLAALCLSLYFDFLADNKTKALSYTQKSYNIFKNYKADEPINYLNARVGMLNINYVAKEVMDEYSVQETVEILNECISLGVANNYKNNIDFLLFYLELNKILAVNKDVIIHIEKLNNYYDETKLFLAGLFIAEKKQVVPYTKMYVKTLYNTVDSTKRNFKARKSSVMELVTSGYFELSDDETISLANYFFDYKEYANAAKLYTQVIVSNKTTFDEKTDNNILLLLQEYYKREPNLILENFSSIIKYAPTSLAKLEKTTKFNSCNDYEAMARKFEVIKNKEKVNEYKKKVAECEQDLKNAETKRQKVEARNRKKREKVSSGAGVYIGLFPLEFRKSSNADAGYGGHVIFKGVKKSFEIGYSAAKNKENQFNYFGANKAADKDDFKSKWTGDRYFVGFRKNSKKSNYIYNGIKLMYADRKLEARTSAVKSLTNNATTNIIFDKITEKQYTFLIVTGVKFRLFKIVSSDLCLGFGASYQQFNGGNLYYNDPTKYEIKSELLRSKPTYFSPQIDLKWSVGLQF